MRRALILAVLAPLAFAAPASAHTIGMDTPVIVLAGSQHSNVDCKAVLGRMKSKLEGMEVRIRGTERQFKKIVTLGPQSGATGCDESLSGDPTSTDAVARRFADWLDREYSSKDQPVDIIAEGTSGVVVRYALGMSATEQKGWPKLRAEDVVTLGAPHGGVTGACDRPICEEQRKADSKALWKRLAQPGFQHPGRSDWSAIGSAGDEFADADSAIAFDADHKTRYKGTLTHQALLDDTSSERDAQIDYQHRGGELVTWNKAPHAIERAGLELVYGADRDATATRCQQEVADWKLEFDCRPSGDVLDGATNIAITTPSGLSGEIPSVPGISYTLPLSDQNSLLLPIVLPNLNVRAGGLQLTAYENVLDREGVTVGTAGVTFPRIGSGTAYDLRITRAGNVSAGSLEVDALGGFVAADDIAFERGAGLRAGSASFSLPARLGGSQLDFRDLRIDSNGALHGTLEGGRLMIGNIAAQFTEAKVDEKGFSIGSAKLELPDYLGGSTLQATNLKWDGQRMTLDEASGELNFALSGGKVKLQARVDLKLDGRGGYEIGGKGRVVGPGSPPFFEAAAEVRIRSIDCKPAPGPCTNAAFLQRAELEIVTPTPIPLGTTGLGIRGLSGKIQASQRNPRRDAEGNVHGVVYTFGIGASIVTIPNRAVFDGEVKGAISTNGNFGLTIDGTILKFVQVHGGTCVIFDTLGSDAVCSDALTPAHQKEVVGPGAYVDAEVKAGVAYSSSVARFSAQLKADAFGRFVRSGGQSYVDATLSGDFTASAGGRFLPDVEGTGSLSAQLGRFRKPGGGETLGIKGKLYANLRATSLGITKSWTEERSIFVNDEGELTEENVNAYNLVAPTAANPKRAAKIAARQDGDDTYEFDVERGQTQTMVVLSAKQGSPQLELTTPGGQQVTVTGPGELRAAPGADRDELRDIYSVHTRVPHSVSVYLPDAQPEKGRWSARPVNVTPGEFSIDVVGNEPLPRLAVTHPGRATKVTRRRPAVALRGTLSRARSGSTVTLYADRGGTCARRRGVPVRSGAALAIARNVPVRNGSWKRRWNTRKVPGGRYMIMAELNNGPEALVVACAKAPVDVVVKRKPARKRKPPRKRKRPAAPKASMSFVDFAPIAPARRGESYKEYCDTEETNQDVLIPRFTVTLAMQMNDIAINDAAAITGTDPLTNKDAQTLDENRKNYEPYEWPVKPNTAPAVLHWGRFANQPKLDVECEEVGSRHRRQACKGRPFAGKHKPAPGKTSCDEYPMASTAEGGRSGVKKAIIRGVKREENDRQGGNFGAFVQEYADELAATGGKFEVCIEYKKDATSKREKPKYAGICGPPNYMKALVRKKAPG